MNASEPVRTEIDIDSLGTFLGMQATPLLEEDETGTEGSHQCQDDDSGKEADNQIADDESYNRASGSGCSPIDVSSLKSHEFKGFLKPLENWILGMDAICIHCFHPLHLRRW